MSEAPSVRRVYPLTEDQTRFYHENGYLLVPKMFSSEECDAFLEICEKHANKDYSTLLNLDREVPELRSVMKDWRIVTVLEALYPVGVVGIMCQIIYKKVGTPYAAQAWNPHQDNSYIQVKNGTYVVSSIFLADTNRENGGLYFYPGSHQEGLFPFEPTVSYREAPGTHPGNTIRVPEKYQRVDLSIPKGGVLFFQGNVVHGSYPNFSHRSRPVLSYCYVTKGASYLEGKNAKRIPVSLH